MRKTRKTLSLLLALAMVLTLFSGIAAASTLNTTFSSGFTNVTTGDNRTGGTITATERVLDSWGNPTRIFMEVTLPEGVTFNDTPDSGDILTDFFNVADATSPQFEAGTSNMLRVSVVPAPGGAADSGTFRFNVDAKSRLNIASAVTGDIRATLNVYSITGTTVNWIESETRIIARVAPRAITVSAASPAIVQMGSNRGAARITVSEGAAASLNASDNIQLEILTDGVTFNAAPVLAETGVDVLLTTAIPAGARILDYDVITGSAIFPGRIEITSSLNINPTVTGDIRIRVRSTWADTSVPVTTLTVASIGAVVAVEVTGAANTGATVYAGTENTTVGVAAGNASFNIRATGGFPLPQPRIVVLSLSSGEFADADPFVVQSRVGTGAWADRITTSAGITRFDNNTKAWFETATWGGATEIRIRNFEVAVNADAAAGDIKVAVSGTLGATGEVTIGTIARPASIAAISLPLAYPGANQLTGSITITEPARGVLADGIYRVELPAGVVLNETTAPRVRVTTGDIRLANVEVISVNGVRTLEFDVTGASIEASTITIDRLSVDVQRAAMEGNLTARIQVTELLNGTRWKGAVNTAAETTFTTLATVVIGNIGQSVSTVFTIDSTTYMVGGVSRTLDVAPTIVDGRTMVPLRAAASAVGVTVDNILFDAGVITIIRGDRVAQFTLNSRVVIVNGVAMNMDVAPMVVAGRSLIPIRWVGTALGVPPAIWNPTARTITVSAQ